MSYEIIESRLEEDTVYTKVKFTLGETILTVEMPHFRPTSIQDIITGIENREVSEQAKLDASVVASQVIEELANI